MHLEVIIASIVLGAILMVAGAMILRTKASPDITGCCPFCGSRYIAVKMRGGLVVYRNGKILWYCKEHPHHEFTL